jgi:hypothetical protein
MQLMGLLETDTLRQPLLPLEEMARAGMSAILREVGLLDAAGVVVGDAGRYTAAAAGAVA